MVCFVWLSCIGVMNSVQGLYHQGNMPFNVQYLGSQCTCMAFVAGVVSRLIQLPEWTPTVINSVLYHGHMVFKAFCEQFCNSRPIYLLHSKLPQKLKIASGSAGITINAHVDSHFSRFGVIESQSTNLEGETISDALGCILFSHDFAILTVDEITVGVFYHFEKFFVFDSHSKSADGLTSARGSATLIGFTEFIHLISYLDVTNRTRAGHQFEVTGVNMSLSSDSVIMTEHFDMLTACHSSYCAIHFGCCGEAQSWQVDCTNVSLKFAQGHQSTVLNGTENQCLVTENEAFLRQENEAPLLHNRDVLVDGVRECGQVNPENLSQAESQFYMSINQSILSVLQSQGIVSGESSNLPESADQTIVDMEISGCNVIESVIFRICVEGSGLRKKRTNRFELFCTYTPRFSCHCCLKLLYDDQVVILCIANDATEALCLEEGSSTVCTHCLSLLKQNVTPVSCYKNMLMVENPPQVLKRLNLIEKRFVSKLQTYMTLVLLPHGQQYGQRGLAIHFPYDVSKNLDALPVDESESPVLFISGSQTVSMVRPRFVYDALKYLKENNPAYGDIEIANERLKQCEQTASDVCTMDFDEMGAVNVDYNVPNVPIRKLVQLGNFYVFPYSNCSPADFNRLTNAEIMAFPWLFPTGLYHRDTPRKRLSLLRYYWTRLYNRDPQFRLDISYILASCNAFEKQSLFDYIAVRLRVLRASKNTSVYVPLTVADIDSAEANDSIYENSYMFMKKIRGTCAYWKDKLWNLMSMIKTLGQTWTDLVRSLSVDLGNSEISSVVRKNPMIVAWHFERRWTIFLNSILLSPQGPFGEVSDYWAGIEFQNRGSPHIHSFFWLKNCPGLHKGSTAADLCDFIDSIVSTRIPDKDLDAELHSIVTVKQMHNHSLSCNRKGKCRFSFPRRVCAKTALVLNADQCSSKSRFRFYEVIRAKGAEAINDYNPTVARAWNANTDCQIIGGYLGAVFYVCNYMCKAEPRELKHRLCEIISGLKQSNTVSLRSQLLQVGMAVLKMRQISAVEACFRLGNLKLTFSSRSVISVPAGFPQHRMKILKPKAERMSLAKDSQDIFQNYVIDYYRSRSVDYTDMCLSKFVSHYRIVKSPGCSRKKRIALAKYELYAVKRCKPACLRVPRFREWCEEYYYCLLLLYLPHFTESELMHPYSVASDAVYHKLADADSEWIASKSGYNELLKCLERLHVNQIASGSLFISPATCDSDGVQESNQEHEFMQNSGNPACNTHCLDVVDNNAINEESLWHQVSVGCLAIESQISNLTKDQLRVFEFIKLCKRQKSVYRVYITGDAGTGKSYLCRFLIDWLSISDSDLSGHSSVIVCAPTGLAARNIKGHTLHSVFKIPVQKGYENATDTLSASLLACLRKQLSGVKTLFIDEISMVSTNLLEKVNDRLMCIRDSQHIFGGLNVIVAGDFFQLRPVRGKFAFTNPILWEPFTPLCLTENVRQSTDDMYCDLLGRAKVGNLTDTDKNLLGSRLTDVDSDHEINLETLRLYPTRRQVVNCNSVMQHRLATAAVHKIDCETHFSCYDIDPCESVNKDFVPEDDCLAGGLSRTLRLSSGTRVMLLKNIAQDDGLINGAMGNVEDFCYEGNDSKPVAIFVKFDDSAVGRLFRLEGDQLHSAVRIDQFECEYVYKGRHLVRRQFPLCSAWAITIHKCQGLSLSNACMSLGKEVFWAGQAYVALSRVRSLEGLKLEKIDFNKIRFSSLKMSFLSLSELRQVKAPTFTTRHIRAKVAHVYDVQSSDVCSMVSIADQSGTVNAEVRAVCPGKERVKAGAVIIIMNAYWSPSMYTFEQDVLSFTKGTMIGKFVCGFEVPESVLVTASSPEQLGATIRGSVLTVAESKQGTQQRVTLKGRIVQNGKLIEFSPRAGSSGQSHADYKECVRNVYLKDGSDRVRVALFRNKAACDVPIGSYVNITALSKGSFKNEITFSSTELTTVEHIQWTEDPVSSEEEEDIDGEAVMASTITIVGYSLVSVYAACNNPRCNRKKLIESTDPKSGASILKCPACGTEFAEGVLLKGVRVIVGINVNNTYRDASVFWEDLQKLVSISVDETKESLEEKLDALIGDSGIKVRGHLRLEVLKIASLKRKYQ